MTIFFWSFSIISFSLFATACLRPAKIFEYPYFMGATFVGFILPQAYSLYGQSAFFGSEKLSDLFLMCLLCVVAVWVGYKVNASPIFLKRISFQLNSDRLLRGGIAFVILGYYFNYLIDQLPEEMKTDLWTGIITIYGFFANLIYPGFTICLYCSMLRRNIVAICFTAIASIIPIQAILFAGRREPTVLFVLTLALSLYFLKGIKPSRLLVTGGVIAAALLIPVTGEYRSLAKQEGPWESMKQLKPLEAIANFNDSESIMELKNAMFVIAAVQATNNYQFGASYWDQMVFRFIPAQIVGSSVKNMLAIGGEVANTSESLVNMTLRSEGYMPPSGSTVTGMADSFWQFGFFGCIYFAIIGIIFKNIWVAANDYKLFAAQLLYIPMITSGMRSITHWTIDFLPGITYSSLFIGLVIIYARERTEKIKF